MLVVGVTGLSAELSKNLVLAGIRSLTLLDAATVTVEDLTAQCFLSPNHVGQNRAQAAVDGIQRLNPNVEVLADTQPVLEKPLSFFAGFTVVCATVGSPTDMVSCRNRI